MAAGLSPQLKRNPLGSAVTTNQNVLTRKIIAALEVTGGLLGFGFLQSFVWPRFGGLFTPFGFVSFTFATLCVAAGVELWRNVSRGFVWSFIAQALQLVAFDGGALAYRLQAGPQLLVAVLRTGRFHFFLGFTSSVQVAPDPSDPVVVSLNLAPLIVLAALVRVWLGRKAEIARPSTRSPNAVPPTTGAA